MKRHVKSLSVVFAALLFSLLIVASPAKAAVLTWTGSAGATWNVSSTFWNNASVGTPWDSTNGTGSIADFNTPSATPSVNGTIFVNGITFDNTATVSNGTILLMAGTLATPTITVNATSGTIGSFLTGTAGLIKTGSGALSLTNSSTYTGGTTVNQGALILSSAGGSAIPGNLAIFGGASNTGNVWATVNNQLSANTVISSVNNSGVASFTLLGTTQTAAGLSSPAGGLMVANATQASGTPSPSNTGASTLILAGSGSYTDAGWVWNAWNPSGGTLNLTVAMTGTGNQTLSGANITYSGTTLISSGTLALQDTTAFGSAITVNAGQALNLNRTANGFASRASLTQLITGPGNINVNNTTSGIAGGWTLFGNSGNGLNNFTGVLSVNSGVLSMDSTVAPLTGNPTLNVVSGGLFGIRGQNVSVGALTGNGDVMNDWNGDNSTGHILTVGANNGSGTFSGTIHGSGVGTADGQIDEGVLNLTKSGTGMQTLSGVSTYSGATLVSGGTLNVISGGAINASNSVITQGGGLLNVSGGTVTVANGGTFGAGYNLASTTGSVAVGSGGVLNIGNGGGRTFVGGSNNNGNNGNGYLTINAGGLINVAAPGAFPNERFYLGGYGGSGTINLNGGTLSTLRDICQAGTVNFNGGTLRAALGYSASTGLLSSGITVNILASGGTIDSNGSNITDVAALSNGGGGGGLTKVGAGMLTVTAISTYTGPTTLSGGTLLYNVGNGVATYPAGTLTVNNGAVLAFSNASYYQLGGWSGGTGTTPVVVNPGGIVQNGTGSIMALNNLTLSGGSLDGVGGWTTGNNWGAFNLFGTLNVTANSSILNISGTNNFISPGSQNGSQTLTISESAGVTLTENLPIEDYGTNVTNLYSLKQSGLGTVVLTGSNTYSGATSITSGTLQIAGGGVLGNGNYSAAISNSGALLFSSSSNQTLGGLISGTGSLTQSGNSTLTLGAVNSFSGPLTINAGTVKLPGGTNSSFLTGNPNIFVNSGGTLAFSGYNSLSVTTGAAPAVTVNAGTILSSPLETFNNLTLNSGTVSVNDNDAFGGTWGSLAFGQTLTANGNSVINALSGFTGTIQNANNGNGGGGFQTFTVLTPAATDSLTISTAIQSSLGLVKLGSGLLTLSNSTDTYSGATTISGGTLTLQDTTSTFGSPFPSAVAVNAGTTLNAVRTALGYANRSVILGNGITGSGVININNAGSGINGGWTEVSGGAGSMNFSGTININSGVFGRDNTNTNTILGTATVNLAAGAVFGAGRGGNSTIGALNGAGDVSSLWSGSNQGSITIGNGGGSGSFSGILHGNGTNGTDGTIEGGILSVIKTGSGTQILSGVNTYTGATTVNNGLLSITGGGVIPATNTLVTQTGGSMSIVNGSVSMSSGGGFGDGYGAVGTGTVLVGSGGTLNVGTGGGLVFVGGGGSSGPYGNGTLTVTAGGLVNVGVPGAFPSERLYMGGYGGTGVINISGGTLATARDITAAGSGGTLNFNAGTLRAASGYTFNTGILTSGMTCYIQAGGATIDSNGFNVTVAAPMLDAGGGGLTKVGAGILSLTSNGSTFSGNTLVSSGTLSLPTGAPLQDSTLDTSGSGVVAFTFGANGTWITGGLTGPGNLPITTTQGFAANIQVGNNNQSTTFTGAITGIGNLTKIGSGMLTMSGSNNTVSGSVDVTGGTLNVAGGGALTNPANVYTQTAGLLNISNGTITVASNAGGAFGVGYGATGTGTVTVGSGGVLNIGAGGSRTFIGGATASAGVAGTGILNVNSGGTVNVAAAGAFPNDQVYLAGYGGSGTINLNSGGLFSTARSIATGGPSIVNFNGGTLQAAASSSNFINAISAANVLSGGANIDTQGNNVTISQALLTGASPDGGLTKFGVGALTLSASNTYNGGTNVNAGTLIAANNSAFGSGTVALNGGTLGISGVVVANSVTLNGGALSAIGNGFIAGNISGSGGLAAVGSGVLVLSGTNTYSGPTVINSGTVRLGGGVLPAGTKVMPVGDSITYGVGGTNASYRGFLYSDLTATGNTFQFVGTTNGNPGSLPSSPINQQFHDGWSGWTSLQIASTIGPWLTTLNGNGQTPTVITLMIGTNDPGNGYSVSQTTANIASIINTAYADDPSVKFLLGSITPRFDNSSYNAANQTVNADLAAMVAQDQASGDNISLVDLTTNFPSNGLTSDNLHPNDTGYSWMASQWTAAILSGQSSAASSSIPSNSPTTVAAGATLDLASNPAAIGPLSGAGSITLGSLGGLTVNSTSGSTFSGTISGAAGVTKAGSATLTFNGPNTYTGTTLINLGALAIGPSGSLASSSVNIASGARLDVTAAGYVVPFGQTITGAGTVSVGSGMALTLNSGAAITAGSSGVGALTVNGGTLTLNTGSSLNVGATAPGVNSILNVTGVLNLASNGIGVNVLQAGTTLPFNTDGTYTLATYGSLAGSTSNLLSYSALDLSKLYSYAASSGSLSVSITDAGPVWTGNSSASWSDSGNWSTMAAPVNGQVLLFAGTNTSNTNDLVGLQASGLQINSGAASFNLTGNSIQLSNGLSNLSGNSQSVGLNIVMGSNLAVNASSPITITGTLSDGGSGYGLTLSGSSTLVLAASNTYSGTTTINSGVLQLGTGAADGSVAGSIVNNGQLVFQPATANAMNGPIVGSGSVVQAGPGSVVLAGSNTYSGGTTVSGGALTIPSSASLSSGGGISVSAAVLNINGPYTNTGAGLVQIYGGGVVNLNAAAIINGTTSEVIVGNGSGGTLNVTGGSLLINNSSAGGASPTSLAGLRVGNAGGTGTLNITGGAVTLGTSDEFLVGYDNGIGSVTVSNGTLNLGSGGRVFIGGNDNGNGQNSGVGTVNVNSGGLLTIGTPGAFPNERVYFGGYNGTGIINVGGGTISSARDIWGQTAGTVTLNGAYLQAATGYSSKGGNAGGAGSGFLAGSLSVKVLSGGVTVDSNGNNITIADSLLNGGGGGGLTKVGSGTLALTAASSFTGPLTINAGTVTLPGGTNGNFLSGDPNVIVNSGATLGFTGYNSFGLNTSAMSTVTVNSGTILSSSTSASPYTILFNNLTLNSGTASINGNDIYLNWGTFGFAGVTTATGNSMVNVIAGTGTIGNSDGNSPTFTVLTPAASDSLTISAVIQNDYQTESFVTTGNGVVTLTAANLYTGSTTISGGTLQLGTGQVGQNGSINGTSGVTDNATLLYNLAGSQTASYSIGGGGAVAKSGSGLLVLAGSNGYSGGTFVQNGTLRLGNSAALGTGALAANGGTLDLNGLGVTVGSFSGAAGLVTNANPSTTASFNVTQTVPGTFSGQINDGAGPVAFNLSGNSVLTLANTNAYSAGTTVSSGTLRTGAANALPFGANAANVTVNGTLDLAGQTTNVNGFSGAGTANNSSGNGLLVAGNNNATSTFSGTIQNSAGTLGLTKTGSGTLTLAGAGTYAGATTVNGGVLVAGQASALSPNSAHLVGTNGTPGTLDVTAGPQSIGALTVGASGTLNISAAYLLHDSGAATFAVGSTIDISSTSAITSLPYALMTYNGSANGTFSNVIGLPSTDTLRYSSGSLDVVSIVTGPPTWQYASSGSWTSQNNWNTGAVPSGVGALAIVGTNTGSSMSITLDTPQTLGTLVLTNSGGNASAGYSLDSGTAGMGSLTLDNSGAAALITVNVGTHAITAPVYLVGGDLTVSASNGGILTISGSISQDMTRNLNFGGDGTGELILSGTNNLGGSAGTATVASGTLVLNDIGALADGTNLTVGNASFFGGIQSAGAGGAVSIAPVPEPSTLGLLAAVLAAGIVYRRRNLRRR